jgi:hypothetical protein
LLIQNQQKKNPLWRYFKNNGEGKSIHKWHHYFDVYHNHFQRFRGQPITILEIEGIAAQAVQLSAKDLVAFFGTR